MKFGRPIRIGLLCFSAVILATASSTPGQDRRFAMDEPVAKVTTADAKTNFFIRYSDVLTQLALQPGSTMDPPSSSDFNAALQVIVNQRIFEARAIEEAAAFEWTPPHDGVEFELKKIATYFPSQTEFETRLKFAGFDSSRDENLFRVISRRLYIEWYLDVHFRRHLRPTREVEQRYYDEIFVPDFRRRHPGLVLPTFEDKRAEISGIVIQQASDVQISKFLKRAREIVRIEILLKP